MNCQSYINIIIKYKLKMSSITYFSRLPPDVDYFIYRYLHEMNMTDLISQLKKEMSNMNDILSYLQKSTFYPYIIRMKIFKNYYFRDDSLYCKNKVYRYIHYKLLSQCLMEMVGINP